MENFREKLDKRDEELEARFLLGMKGKKKHCCCRSKPKYRHY